MSRIRFLVFAVMLVPLGCVPRVPSGAPTRPPVVGIWQMPPNCAGGPSVGRASMNANEIALVNLILDARTAAKQNRPGPDPIAVGLAQWHAQDMAVHDYIGFVGSDGEDVFSRYVCSGATPSSFTGVTMVGRTSDAGEVFKALNTNFAVSANLYNPFFNKSLSVGYNDGYWVIVQQ